MLFWLERIDAVSMLAPVAACGDRNDDAAPPPAPPKNIVNTLNGAGPFTVVAPTNAAFASLLTPRYKANPSR